MQFEALEQPLGRRRKITLATLLASAFLEDDAMVRMLGRDRWQQVANRYFFLQLDHPDCILTVRQEDSLIGVLLASSPVCSPSFFVHARELLGMMWLLGPHFSESQQIASTIVSELPRQPIWYINQLAVLPDQQGRGLGSALLQELSNLTGSFPVYVDCEHSLESFYGAAGFSLRSRTPSNLSVMARNQPQASG